MSDDDVEAGDAGNTGRKASDVTEASPEGQRDQALPDEAPPDEPKPEDVKPSVAPPMVTGVHPAVIALGRETTLAISGAGFADGCVLRVGGDAIDHTRSDAGNLSAKMQPAKHATLDVEVENPDGQRGFLAGAVRVVEGPIIESIAPRKGPPSGGTLVIVSGRGFEDGATVAFFDAIVPSVTFDGSTRLSFVTRPHDEGSGSIRVTSLDGLSFELAAAFTYEKEPPPKLARVSPARAVFTGGARLTLEGEGFHPSCKVLLGGAPLAVTFKDATSMTVVVPAVGEPKTVDVHVENPDGQSSKLEGAFSFTPIPAPPKLIAVSPRTGFTTGGQLVVLQGQNFDETTAVRIADVRTTVRFKSSTELECETPPREEPGAVAVEVFTPEGISLRYEEFFSYEARPQPKITGVAPNNGPTTGGTKVVIEGEGFAMESTVRIGREAPKSAVVRSTSRIEIVTAPSKEAGMVDVIVSSQFTAPATMKAGFRYDARPAPVITSVSPNKGSVGGGTEVSITGKNFIAESVVLVAGKPVKAKLVDATTLELKMPGGTDGQMVDVAVKNPDGKEAVSKRAFQYDARYR